MNGQPIRIPGRLILGGCDTAEAGSARYCHLGPFVFEVERAWNGRWAFRFAKFSGRARFSVRVRI